MLKKTINSIPKKLFKFDMSYFSSDHKTQIRTEIDEFRTKFSLQQLDRKKARINQFEQSTVQTVHENTEIVY